MKRYFSVSSLLVFVFLPLTVLFQNFTVSDGGTAKQLPSTVAFNQQDRSRELLTEWLRKTAMPKPGEPWRYRCSAYTSYVISSFHLEKSENYRQANEYLKQMTTETQFGGVNLPQHGGGINQEVDCSWAIQLLARIALEPRFYRHVKEENRRLINKALLDFVFSRSKVADLSEEKIWDIRGSENHHSINYGGYYLALLAHRAQRPNFRLADGKTVAEHVAAWENYWKSFIIGRAKHGLHSEVASSTYEKYTIATYYNLRDLSPNRKIQQLSENFLTLVLADAAQEFIAKTGARGGAATRTYKALPLTHGKVNELYNLGYVYGWHDLRDAKASQSSITALVSSYRAPEILKTIATSVKKPFHYTSRRIGRSDAAKQPGSELTTLNFGRRGEGSIRRYSYVTPDYIIGSMSFDPNVSFSAMSDQNRSMGVVDASDVNSRIMVIGVGSGGASEERSFLGSVSGYAEISGVGRGNSLIVARDLRAKSSSGTQVYLSSAGGLWDNSTAKALLDANQTYSGGWIFTSSAVAYYAIRIASGSIQVKDGASGKALELTDMWSPVIIQAGSKKDFESESDFREQISKNTQFSYVDGKLNFIDLSGHTFDYQAKSKVTPSVTWFNEMDEPEVQRGGPIRYDTRYTFISPYILGRWGEETVTIRFPRKESLVLSFDQRE